VRLELYVPGAPLEGDVVVVPPGLPAPAPDALGALRAFAHGGGHVLGVAEGVAWLCAAGLLPGAVTTEPAIAAATHVRVEGRATAFTWAIPAGRILPLTRSSEGARFTASDEDVVELAARGRVVLRYCDASGGLARPAPGAHAATIAGVSDGSGRVVGLLAPSTAALDCELGRQVLTCLRARRSASVGARVAESSRVGDAAQAIMLAARLDSATLAPQDLEDDLRASGR
jgi:phosphoribosylformylglycinamidine (FGAM) synthase-like amidotransferase family enzyme